MSHSTASARAAAVFGLCVLALPPSVGHAEEPDAPHRTDAAVTVNGGSAAADSLAAELTLDPRSVTLPAEPAAAEPDRVSISYGMFLYLVGGGVLLFALSYASSFLAQLEYPVPVVGPIIDAARVEGSDGTAAGLGLLGFVQASGLALFAIGMILWHTSSDAAREAEVQRYQVAVMPAPGGGGLAFHATF